MGGSAIYTGPRCVNCNAPNPGGAVGAPCFKCAMAATPFDDPIAVAYRERVAKRATLEAAKEAPDDQR